MQLCGFEVGLERPLFLIAGPCAIESRQLALDTAGQLKEICAALGMPFIYKSSFDKANRSSDKSFRGLGMGEGLKILAEVKAKVGVPVLTDVHEIDQIKDVAAVVDVLQTPAFLCRQTDFIHAVASAGRPVNIKKGQFLSPGEMKNVVAKARAAVASGVAGVFMETHPNPEKALSDGPNAWPLKHMKVLLETLQVLDATVKRRGFAEQLVTTQGKS